MPPPLALFDLDNTLVDRRSAFRLWAETWAAARDLDNAAVDWLVEADHNGDASRMRFFAHAIKRFGLVKKPDQLLSEYRATFPGYFKPDPTVNDGLRALRANGWKIGVVTNGHRRRERSSSLRASSTSSTGW